MRYRWILFDADGTLFDFDGAATAAMAETFAAFDLPYAPGHFAVYEEINHRAWRDFEAGRLTAAQLRVDRFAAFFAAVGVSADPAAFGARYLRQLATHDDLLAGAAEVVGTVAPHAGLLLITNGLAEVQRPRFAGAEICRHFADIVISGEVGAAKPDPRIFDVAFARMGDPPRREVLIVGDSLTSDIAGGAAYGIDTCWFNPQGRPRGDAAPTYEIGALHDLPALLRA